MMYEEKKEIRRQMAQLLADAGLNQATIKAMIEEEIKTRVESATEQVISHLNAQSSSGNYIADMIIQRIRSDLKYPNNYKDIVTDILKNKIVSITLKDTIIDSDNNND